MDDAEPGDRALVERARRGDSEAFESLVRRHARRVFATALSILANHADAEDVCQDAWVQALVRIEECRQPERFIYWLLQVVRNRARNYVQYRRVRVTETLEDSFGPDGPPSRDDPSLGLRRERLRAALEKTLAKLSDTQREVVLLHDLAGWTHREIGESLEMSEVMCRQHLFQARARMRKLLGVPTERRE